MLLLFIYVMIALVFSFLCSIAEAVILSVSPAYIAVLDDEGKRAGKELRELKENINKPLAAILTLNTVAHTLGAAGAGAQATLIYGEASLGIASAILTLLILVFSEIIPKTLGATYWRTLAPATAYGLKALVWLLYPFVQASEMLTKRISKKDSVTGFNRIEFSVMAELSMKEGLLAEHESTIIKNLFRFQNVRLKDIMTPRIVVFSLPETATVGFYFHRHDKKRFSRIPIYDETKSQITGFVLRSELLLAQARGNAENSLSNYRRNISTIPETVSISRVFNELLNKRTQLIMAVDEYGDFKGIVTLEDILETLIGLEIVDEGDSVEDMQELAKKLWQKRIRKMGVEL